MTRQRQALGLLRRHQQRDDLHDFRLVFLLLDFLRHREHFDVLQNHLRKRLVACPFTLGRDQHVHSGMRQYEARDIADLIHRHRHRAHPERNQQRHYACRLVPGEQLGLHDRLVGYQRVLYVAANDLFGIGVRPIWKTVGRPSRRLYFPYLDLGAERKVHRRHNHFDVVRHGVLHFGLSPLQGGIHHHRSQHRS